LAILRQNKSFIIAAQESPAVITYWQWSMRGLLGPSYMLGLGASGLGIKIGRLHEVNANS